MGKPAESEQENAAHTASDFRGPESNDDETVWWKPTPEGLAYLAGLKDGYRHQYGSAGESK